jgi:hypothetical protein
MSEEMSHKIVNEGGKCGRRLKEVIPSSHVSPLKELLHSILTKNRICLMKWIKIQTLILALVMLNKVSI